MFILKGWQTNAEQQRYHRYTILICLSNDGTRLFSGNRLKKHEENLLVVQDAVLLIKSRIWLTTIMIVMYYMMTQDDPPS